MRNIQDIMIRIIIEDMRFNQYTAALSKLGIEVHDLNLSFMEIVAMLMGITEYTISDEWMELYVSELNKCKSLPIAPSGKNLYALAEECYDALLDFYNYAGSNL